MFACIFTTRAPLLQLPTHMLCARASSNNSSRSILPQTYPEPQDMYISRKPRAVGRGHNIAVCAQHLQLSWPWFYVQQTQHKTRKTAALVLTLHI